MDDDSRYDPQAGRALPARFSGGSARSGPVTVGQANMRRCVLRDDPAHLNACLVLPVPDGVGLDALADAVRVLALRHESLRTLYPVDPELQQVVLGEGGFTLRVHEADEADGPPGDVARAVGERLRSVRFEPRTELPLRAAVVTAGGRPRHMVLVLCHIAVDAAGIDLLTAEWHAVLAGRALPEPPAVQPVDLALTEHSELGRRRLASSLRYWENQLRTTPQSMFAVPGVGPCDWMLGRLRVRSRSAARALTVVAERTGTSRATLVLAAMCALLAHRLGQRTVVVATPAANRFLPELADYIGTVAQDGLVSVRTDDVATFDELAARVRGRALAALRHSWFDYDDLLPRIERAERDRGSHWARDCVFNDLSTLTLEGLLTSPPVPADGAGPSPRDRTAAAPDGDVRVDWFRPEPMLTRLMLWTVRLEEELELALWADPNLLPAAEAEAFGAGVARLLGAAADGDVPLDRLEELTGLAPVARGEGWYLVDSCWVDLASVQAMVEEVAGGPSLVAAVPDDVLGHRLECWTAGGHDPAALHTACLAALRHRRLDAMAPHRYTVVDRAPDDPADPAAWRTRTVLAEGTGRTATAAAVTS
ncbi:condensation domain-containing protein [Streptomyces sp. V4-01]|uniref:Condensation domain-containing protein n=1 Tax=Actinacidiphila polyblastidii TaxID=3110430 RepID=A0ABU7PID3_9ACTN|nr:condensation domain-containing protein [Streptomyces sp. V4-01]